jgi:hypothetical protein
VSRIRPTNRRLGETFDVELHETRYAVSVGRLEDGSPIEVFVSCHKAANALEALARDAGIVISFAIQHGAAPVELRDAVSRETSGQPTSIIGVILDAISKR